MKIKVNLKHYYELGGKAKLTDGKAYDVLISATSESYAGIPPSRDCSATYYDIVDDEGQKAMIGEGDVSNIQED